MSCLAPAPPPPPSPSLTPPCPVWDAHMHVHELTGHKWDSPPERAIAVMDPVGIEKAVIMPYSEIDMDSRGELEVGAEYARRFPDRFLLFARLHPGEGSGAEELLEWAVTQLGYVGLKLHPVGSQVAPTHPLHVHLVQKAAALGLPILFHCGDEALTTPDELGPLAEKVPEANIIMGHCGGYFHGEQALTWAKRVPNLYFETSAIPDLTLLRRALDELGPERILWGSDGPGCLPYLELHKLLHVIEGFEAHVEDILGNNLKRLLKRLEVSP